MKRPCAINALGSLEVVLGGTALVLSVGLAASGGAACGIRFAEPDGGPDAMTDAVDQDGGTTFGCFADGGFADQCPAMGLVCCAQVCANTSSDAHNCGGCGVQCESPNGACRQSSCQH